MAKLAGLDARAAKVVLDVRSPNQFGPSGCGQRAVAHQPVSGAWTEAEVLRDPIDVEEVVAHHGF